MAVITTYGLMEVLYGRSSGPDLTPALDSLTSANYQPPGIVTPATALPGAGSIVRNEPISEIPRAYSAWRMPTFLDDYYNRIHIRPSNVNVGNLVSEQQFAIEVWNVDGLS